MSSVTARTLTLVPSHSAREDVKQTLYDDSAKNTTISSRENILPVWACIYFPRISLEVSGPVETDRPLVVFQETKGKQLIYAACEAAQNQGIMPGMPLNAARVLCRELTVRKRNVDAEEQEIKKRARQFASFTPSVTVSGTDTILLELSRSLRLFGGFDRLWQILQQVFPLHSQDGALGEVVAMPQMSCTPSPIASTLLAHAGEEEVVQDIGVLKSRLGGVSIEDAGLAVKTVEQLRRCGLEVLRDLWRLPRAGLARRFGVDLLSYLDRACGEMPDIPPCWVPATRFFHRLELPEETTNIELVLLAAEKLLKKLEVFLNHRVAAVDKIVLTLEHSEGGLIGHGSNEKSSVNPCRTRIVVSSRQYQQRSHHFHNLFNEKLQRLAIPSTVVAVALRVDELRQYRPITRSIFDNCQNNGTEGESWEQLMDRLVARLGIQQIYSIQPVADHRPEFSWCRQSARIERWKIGQRISLPLPPRPCWLLRTPEKMAVPDFVSSSSRGVNRNNVDSQGQRGTPREGNALSVSGGGSESERIESGWWDEQDTRREYRTVITACGGRQWVYRDLNVRHVASNSDANSIVEEESAWYLHGLYG